MLSTFPKLVHTSGVHIIVSLQFLALTAITTATTIIYLFQFVFLQFTSLCTISSSSSSSLFFTGQNFWGGWFNSSDRGKVRRRGGFCKYPQC